MQIKLLHDLIEEMAGEGTGRIVEILFGKKDVNEFTIAKRMELTINQVRNILYKLSADGLVSFIRKKDKRKGWYIYYWTLKTEKCLIKLEKSLLSKIEELGRTLNNRETKRYYICKSCDIEVTEEKALENGFTCEECAEVYELSDTSGAIRETKTKITKTEKDLKLIVSELEEIREKDRRKRARADKKAEKELKAKKELMRIARAKARKKIAAEKEKLSPKKKKVVKKKKPKVKKKAKKKAVRKKVAKKKKKTAKKKSVKKKVVKKKKPKVKKKSVKKKVKKKAVRKKVKKKKK